MRASTLIAAMTSELSHNIFRSAIAMMSMPSMPSVPLIRARPSFSRSSTGSMPAFLRSCGTASSTPSGPVALPSPIKTRAQCDSGARSPLQPKDPNSRTIGVMPALSSAAIVSTTMGRTPVCPEHKVLSRSAINARTTSRSTGAPMPAACERINER
ncbi:unannotated protein [freshwater metagenome]|uniref:Unannotated protein n=1 Tax=freshwater metagenome TaxID=449393 RepID=A0A6J5ZRJ7_9ZZZZ